MFWCKEERERERERKKNFEKEQKKKIEEEREKNAWDKVAAECCRHLDICSWHLRGVGVSFTCSFLTRIRSNTPVYMCMSVKVTPKRNRLHNVLGCIKAAQNFWWQTSCVYFSNSVFLVIFFFLSLYLHFIIPEMRKKIRKDYYSFSVLTSYYTSVIPLFLFQFLSHF